jgi:hypothetical protein
MKTLYNFEVGKLINSHVNNDLHPGKMVLIQARHKKNTINEGFMMQNNVDIYP